MSTVCYWKWAIEIVGIYLWKLVIFHSFLYVYQRVIYIAYMKVCLSGLIIHFTSHLPSPICGPSRMIKPPHRYGGDRFFMTQMPKLEIRTHIHPDPHFNPKCWLLDLFIFDAYCPTCLMINRETHHHTCPYLSQIIHMYGHNILSQYMFLWWGCHSYHIHQHIPNLYWG